MEKTLEKTGKHRENHGKHTWKTCGFWIGDIGLYLEKEWCFEAVVGMIFQGGQGGVKCEMCFINI